MTIGIIWFDGDLLVLAFLAGFLHALLKLLWWSIYDEWRQ